MPNSPLLLAHLSDIHLAPMPRLPLTALNVKRALGAVNWYRHRRQLHVRGVLDALVADLRAQKPDHIAVTGDLVNLGLPREHEAALVWLQGLGDPATVTAVPGNHDAYVLSPRDPGYRRWQAFMQGDQDQQPGAQARTPTSFPFLRRVGPIALIGLCSGVPTPPFLSSGILGPRQLADLTTLLRQTKDAGLLRVVAIHHPPRRYRQEWRTGLSDAGPLDDVLRSAGAELVLHGHAHRALLRLLESPAGSIPIVGVPSASAAKRFRHGDLAGYSLFAIEPGRAGGYRIEMIRRGLAEPGGPIVELERVVLAG